MAPTPAPTAPPTPKPRPNYVWAAGDWMISPKIYNEFSPGNTGTSDYTARGGAIFDSINIPFMFEADYKHWQYPHVCNAVDNSAALADSPECFVTAYGSRFATFVPSFTAQNSDVDVRLAVKIFDPHVYVGIGYICGWNNYGGPNLTALGFGAEKLPDYGTALTYYGSVWYYPNYRGTYTNTAITSGPTSYGVGYNLLKYQAGVDWTFVPSIYLDLGWAGENGANKNNAPISFHFAGFYGGLGFFLPF
jgi:hypothetical protein